MPQWLYRFRAVAVWLLGCLLCLIAGPGAAHAAGADTSFGSWYLQQDRAAQAQAEFPVDLKPVRIAVVDSGIDGGHPLFAARIVAARSFIGGSALTDEIGHGTFVAGEIASVADAALTSARGAALVQLVIAKIARSRGGIEPTVEARAIRWAVDEGSRVINLSLGGVRDPGHPGIDQYSAVEAAAVRYAIAHHAVVVAAVGNGDQAPSQPWPHASWPAALPHVIGVSAIALDGSVPDFSNRDPVYNEVAAPGTDIVSAFPRALTGAYPDCVDQGYSDCGTPEYRQAEGTSFAAPQVAAAAGLLLVAKPQLTPDQVSWLLERSADDANPATGCSRCTFGRDPLTGWGTLDIAAAVKSLAASYPPADPYDPNDDAGRQAFALGSHSGAIRGTLDFWENPIDVFRIHLRIGEIVHLQLHGSVGGIRLLLWNPRTTSLGPLSATLRRQQVAAALQNSLLKSVAYRAQLSGWFYIEVELTAKTNAAYTLRLVERPRDVGLSQPKR